MSAKLIYQESINGQTGPKIEKEYVNELEVTKAFEEFRRNWYKATEKCIDWPLTYEYVESIGQGHKSFSMTYNGEETTYVKMVEIYY